MCLDNVAEGRLERLARTLRPSCLVLFTPPLSGEQSGGVEQSFPLDWMPHMQTLSNISKVNGAR